MTTSIFDCCDACDAVLSEAEKAKSKRFDQTLCDGCAADVAAANPGHPDATAAAQPVPAAPVKKVCSHCGSDDVVNDAVVRWDIRTQAWRLSDIYDDQASCCVCEGDTKLASVPVDSSAASPSGFVAVTFADFVVTHGFGDPLPEAYDIGRQLMEDGDDIATAAAEVVARGLTTRPEDGPGTYTVLVAQSDGRGELHVSTHEGSLDEASDAGLAEASRAWERPVDLLRVVAVFEGEAILVA